MAKDAQAEIINIGLQDEGGMVDEASGNEVPNGALKEEVRDDQPAMLSPGEFVIPAYAVRYIGVERLVSILREAKQGMEQLDDIGLTGEPNADDAGLETAVLPSEMQKEGGMPKLAVGGFPTIIPGGVTRTALPSNNQLKPQQQFGVAPSAAIQTRQQPTAAPAFGTAPSPLTQQMYRPTAPIRPPGQQNVTYPEYQYSPTPGGTGYGVEEYVGTDGQAIFVTTIGGKPISKIPEGYLTRAEYTKKQEEGKSTTTTPPSELQRKPEQIDGDAGIGEPGGPDDPSGSGEGSGGTSIYDAVVDYAYGEQSTGGKIGQAAAATLTGGPLMGFLSFLGIGDKAGRAAAKSFVEASSGKFFNISKEERAEMDPFARETMARGKSKQIALTAANKDVNDAARADAAEGNIDVVEVQTTDEDAEGYITPQEAAAAALDGSQLGVNTATTGLGQDIAAAPYGGDAAAEFGGDSGGGGGGGGGAPGTDVSIPASEGGYDPNVSVGNKGGYIGMAEGGLIKVGDKTYGPEDFGFANKGTFVTKKKTRKRKTKKGKGLASSK